MSSSPVKIIDEIRQYYKETVELHTQETLLPEGAAEVIQAYFNPEGELLALQKQGYSAKWMGEGIKPLEKGTDGIYFHSLRNGWKESVEGREADLTLHCYTRKGGASPIQAVVREGSLAREALLLVAKKIVCLGRNLQALSLPSQKIRTITCSLIDFSHREEDLLIFDTWMYAFKDQEKFATKNYLE